MQIKIKKYSTLAKFIVGTESEQLALKLLSQYQTLKIRLLTENYVAIKWENSKLRLCNHIFAIHVHSNLGDCYAVFLECIDDRFERCVFAVIILET